ncbi:MAG: hypothetical protein H0W17_02625 [Chloroflexi bacterium]|nr:hypothetical protein [Chloroflexota bacterium]
MSERVSPIARIRLSRSPPRLLAFPLLGFLLGIGAIGGGLLRLPGIPGLVVAGLGAAVVLLALAGAIFLLSIRLDIEEAAVRLSWLGGQRIYSLSPGPVTRVRLRGENRSRLRAAPLFLPWQLGAGRLRDEEDVEVVRLAPTATAILVPTERGRLAIAAADEDALLDALSLAARARQRLEGLTRESAADEETEQPAARVEVDPALMTGIERALVERRLADERAAAAAAAVAAAAATAEQLAAEPPAEVVEREALSASDTVQPVSRRWRLLSRLRLRRPTWARWPTSGTAVLVLPLIAAGMIWGIAALLDRMPQPGTDVGRLTALALVLSGPATTVGAIMARVWWPRLVGVVVAGGLAAIAFVGRALLG